MFENLATLCGYVQQFGAWAPLAAFILFVIQAAVPVFPYIILAAGGGMLFGFKIGFLLAWLGALTGACLAFWVCRCLGYSPLSQWLFSHYGYEIDNHNPSVAFWSIIIARIIPVVPTPLINVAAALGGISFGTFFFSSAIGKLPSAILYTGLGLAIFSAKDIKTILWIIAGAILFLLGLKWLTRKLFPGKQLSSQKNVTAHSTNFE